MAAWLLIGLACFSALAGYALALKMSPMYPGAKDVDWTKPCGGFGEPLEEPPCES